MAKAGVFPQFGTRGIFQSTMMPIPITLVCWSLNRFIVSHPAAFIGAIGLNSTLLTIKQPIHPAV